MNVGNEVLLGVVERLDASPQGVELVGRELAVDRAPGNGWGGRFFNDETVDWRTAGTVTGFDNQCASIGKHAFTALQRFFTSSSTLRSVYTVLLACVMRFPIRPVAECSKRFVVERKNYYSEKSGRIMPETPKKVGPSRRNCAFPQLENLPALNRFSDGYLTASSTPPPANN
jgi:hypothetical protein